MSAPQLKQWPSATPIRLENITCVYCGGELNAVNDTIEHVIARRFEPKGKLDGQWSLIVHTCRDCNRFKAGLEDDTSAITMQPSAPRSSSRSGRGNGIATSHG